MSSAGVFSNQIIAGLAVRNVEVSLLARLLQQQKAAGAAMVRMIDGGTVGRPAAAEAPVDAPAAAPQKGAPEPGKGSHVDVIA